MTGQELQNLQAFIKTHEPSTKAFVIMMTSYEGNIHMQSVGPSLVELSFMSQSLQSHIMSALRVVPAEPPTKIKPA